jgi:hypothetical protein
MWISGTWPPWGRPSLISASEISQLEKAERLERVNVSINSQRNNTKQTI